MSSLDNITPEEWDQMAAKGTTYARAMEKAYAAEIERRAGEQKASYVPVAHLGYSSRPLDTQVGGNHYKEMKIQPIEFIMANQLNFCEANIVKYAARHHAKGGAEDIRKVIHYAKLLLELEYGVTE